MQPRRGCILQPKVIQALVPHREPDLTAFHYVSEIPEPPEAFIAHPDDEFHEGKVLDES